MGSKNTNWAIIAIVLIVIVAMSSGFQFSNIGNWFSGLMGGGETGLVNVNKQIKFHLINKYSGGAIDTGNNVLDLYDSDGETIVDADLETDANGHATTGSDYPSGKVMYLRYEESNDKQWFKFTVPQMNAKDAESATYNLIDLQSFTIGTYNNQLCKWSNGTSLSDGDTHDVSNGDGTTPHFIYTLSNTGNDNTGIMTSYDPEYDQNWNVVFWMQLSGTGYESVIVYDLNFDFTLGTTHYLGKVLDPYAATKHKVGPSYKSLGVQDVSFWCDLTGLESGDSVTLQIYVKAYADQVYAQNHGGSFGPEVVQLDEFTITLAY